MTGPDKHLVEILVSKGADVNAKTEMGTTPLHQAALAGYKSVAEFLLSKGADSTAKTRDGDMPLQWALINDHTDVADLLRQPTAR